MKFEPKNFDKEQYNLLITAFNNRTRQANFFNLYCKYLLKEITTIEFENEIQNNSDKYVVPKGTSKSSHEIMMAGLISQNLLNVDSTPEFMAMFEIDEESLTKFMTEN